MKILIIGGTKFSGRHIVKAALEKGHEVTIFHRGNNSTMGLGDVEEIIGDRIFDLDKLANWTWDVVIDMCGYLPKWVESSADALKDSVNKYVFVSSVSAYEDNRNPNFDETAKLAELTAEQAARFARIDAEGDFGARDLGDLYGPLKTMCEREVAEKFAENHLIIRPGLIVGKYDWTDRWTYWVMRVAKGGEVLAPGKPNAFVQFIDANDLAKWLIYLVENDEKGIYNAVNKPSKLTFGKMLETIKDVSKSDAEFTWVSEEFLEENEVAPWSDMPLYLPESLAFMRTANVDKAYATGLQMRDLKDTISNTLNWRRTLDEKMKAGITAERETALLLKWKA